MGKLLKLVAVNFAVLLACLLVLNLFASIYLDVEDWVTDEFPSYDERIDLPNFSRQGMVEYDLYGHQETEYTIRALRRLEPG